MYEMQPRSMYMYVSWYKTVKQACKCMLLNHKFTCTSRKFVCRVLKTFEVQRVGAYTMCMDAYKG